MEGQELQVKCDEDGDGNVQKIMWSIWHIAARTRNSEDDNRVDVKFVR